MAESNSFHRPVHPRAGGEHPTLSLKQVQDHGSSPRGRGTLAIAEFERDDRRFIPARAGNTLRLTFESDGVPVHPRAGGEHGGVLCGADAGLRFIPARAGNTTRWRVRSCITSVHPRAGGEHGSASGLTQLQSGSSPRGRGTLPRGCSRAPSRRFIPARAGNTPGTSRTTSRSSVHPRAGAEHPSSHPAAYSGNGSSPRGRGTPLSGLLDACCDRFIPARAGNTPASCGSSLPLPVHPRAGGEHSPVRGGLGGLSGSSPRGRGTRVRLGGHFGLVRFIPARAGNTVSSLTSPASPSVHPRAGGEHWIAGADAINEVGSSPRGRGTPPVEDGVEATDRFIPARAGNTHEASAIRIPATVHPRAGGEHVGALLFSLFVSGSSPRGRGTQEGRSERALSRRFIPARAGNTEPLVSSS